MQYLKLIYCLCVLLFFFFSHPLCYGQNDAPIEKNHTVILLTLRGRPYPTSPHGGERKKLIELFNRMIKQICLTPQEFAQNRPLIGEQDYYSFLGHGLKKGYNLNQLLDTSGIFFTHRQGEAAKSINQIIQTLPSYSFDRGIAFQRPGIEFARTEAMVKTGLDLGTVNHIYIVWIGKGPETFADPDQAYAPKKLIHDGIDTLGLKKVKMNYRKLKDFFSFDSEITNHVKFLKNTFNDYGAEMWVRVYEVLPNLSTLRLRSFLKIEAENFHLTRQNGQIGWKGGLKINRDQNSVYSPFHIRGLLISDQQKDTTIVNLSEKELQESFRLSFFHSGKLVNPRIELQCWTKIHDGYYNSFVFPYSEQHKDASREVVKVKQQRLRGVLFSRGLAENLYKAIPLKISQSIHALIANIILGALILVSGIWFWMYGLGYLIILFRRR
jgi:hypothetical protein